MPSLLDLGAGRRRQRLPGPDRGRLTPAALFALCGLFALCALCGAAEAVTVGLNCRISWEASPSPIRAAVRLYRARPGQAFTKGAFVKEVPTTPSASYTVDWSTCADWGLVTDGAYVLAITSVDAAGHESDFSPTLQVSVQATGPLSPLLFFEELQSGPAALLAHSANFHPSQPVAHLLDGCTTDTPACMSGNQRIPSFWVLLDLGRPVRLTRARLFGDANGTWRTQAWALKVACGPTGPWMDHISSALTAGNAWQEQTFAGTTARYVRVEVTGPPTGTQAREVEVYGSPAPFCPPP